MWRVGSVLRLTGLTKPIPQSEEVLAPTRRRGTWVHAINEAYAYGSVLPGPGGLDAYVDGLRGWYVETQPKVLFAERRIVNRAERCNGKPDLAILDHGYPTVVDVKTGASAPFHNIQAAGYVHLCERDPQVCNIVHRALYGTDFPFGVNLPVGLPQMPRWKRAILLLPGDGSYRWIGDSELDPRDHYLWQAALALVQWRYDHGLLTETDPENPEGAYAHAIA